MRFGESRRRRRAPAALLGALLSANAWACARSSGDHALPRRHMVEIRAMAFQPADLEVTRGDTVVWINRDIFPHTATAAGASGWDTGTIHAGDSRQLAWAGAGGITYLCTLHPTMTGRLMMR